MLVYPSVAANESTLQIVCENAAILDYWRSAVGVTCGNHPPQPKIGALLVAWVRPKVTSGFRTPARYFYLNCCGDAEHLDGVDYPGADDHGCLVDPGSVIPG